MDIEQHEIDSIDPQPRTVLISGVEHTVNPPSFAVYIRLQKVLEQLQLDLDVLDDAKLEQVEQQARACIDKCVPSVVGQQFRAAEIVSLATYILELGTPKRVVANLKGQGITVDTEKKAD